MEELSESKIKILVKAILNEITPSYTQIYFEDFKDLNFTDIGFIVKVFKGELEMEHWP